METSLRECIEGQEGVSALAAEMYPLDEKDWSTMVIKKTTLMPIAIILGAVLLLTSLWLVLDYNFEQEKKRVAIVGFEYAKNQCVNQKYPKKVCENLKSRLVPPPDWGTQSYLMYVSYEENIEEFDSSMAIEIINGKPEIIRYTTISE